MPRVKFGSLSLEAPSEWTLQAVILAGPPNAESDPSQAFQRNLITTFDFVGPDETAQSYLKRQNDGLEAAHIERNAVGAPEVVHLEGGAEGLLTEQVVLGQTGQFVRQMQLLVVKDGIAHSLIASHLDGAPFEAARDQFRRMLLSFR